VAKRIGYAVVGLGDIARVAVLPAFAHSRKSRLVAVVSGDKGKAVKIASTFGADYAFSYDQYSQCLEDPRVEAVYIATPPGVREKYVVAAAKAGRHVLCEKPLAATVEQARNMVHACRHHKVKFMTAYRKYFEGSTTKLKEIVTRGDLGRLDVIHTLFSELRPFGDKSPSWLFSRKLAGGGPLMDLGVYCVNTCRWLAGEDPVRAAAVSWVRDARRYKEVEEGIGFRLDFPSGLLLHGTAAYSAAFSSFVHLHGEKGWAELAPAFAFEEERRLSGKIRGKWFQRSFRPVDEFVLELDAFAACIQEDREPEPTGEQGLRDIIIIDSIYRASKEGHSVGIQYE